MAASMKNDKGFGTIAVRFAAPRRNARCTALMPLLATELRVLWTGRRVGVFQEVHMQGGYCSVDWDNGTHDRCLFTGQQQVRIARLVFV